MRLQINENLALIQSEVTAQYTRLNGDLSPLMKAISHQLESSTRERFRTEKAPDGSAWESLKPSTIKGKGHSGILKDDGHMADGITSYYTDTTSVVGSDMEYSGYHQVGTLDIPAREYLGVSNDEDEPEIISFIHQFAKGRLR